MNTLHCDAVVLGVGGVGSAAAMHLARRGLSVVGIDRFRPPHDRGSSHGATRVIRKAYFEHPDYVPLLERAYPLWRELEQQTGQSLFLPVGVLQIGPVAGPVLSGIAASVERFGLKIDQLDAAEVQARWPGFHVPEGCIGLFEEDAGLLRVEACVQAQLAEARRAGADLRFDQQVLSWTPHDDGVDVETGDIRVHAKYLVISAGAWADSLLRERLLAERNIELQVLKKDLYWYGTSGTVYHADDGYPAFLFDLPEGVFYGLPALDAEGLKVGQHTRGVVVEDPTEVNRDPDPADQAQTEQFLEQCLPHLTRELTRHAACLYTMSPDHHFIVDRHPAWPHVVFAAGLSGHGFKFVNVLGEALADMVQGQPTQMPLDFLSLARFEN